jgi:peptide/nickel transport system ATP-binding protein
VLFITHDLSLLLELADRIAVMYAGRLVETAGAHQLFSAPRHPYTAGLLASFPSLHGERHLMTGIPGSPPDLRNPPPGCPFHPRCGFTEPQCRQVMPPLAPPPPTPPSPSPLAGDRMVACWLQDGRPDRPDVVSRPEPPARPAGHVATGPVQP